MIGICDPFKRACVLCDIELSEVWVTGRRLTAHLQAMDLANADLVTLRAKFSVVLERTARELAGVPCLDWMTRTRPSRNFAVAACSASG